MANGFRETWRRHKEKTAYRLSRFLYGRNGPDKLYTVCLTISLIFAILQMIFRSWIFLVLYILYFSYAMFRFFSKNVAKRRRENAKFCAIFTRIKRALTDRKHAYRTCPQCGSTLRLPRVKGTHQTRCPKCGNGFSVKI